MWWWRDSIHDLVWQVRRISGVGVQRERTLRGTCCLGVLDEARKHIVFQAVVLPEYRPLMLEDGLGGKSGELAVTIRFVKRFESDTSGLNVFQGTMQLRFVADAE